ncbi:MAG TPA: biopolymer transporter ExbD, partial [Deltaproteobacteria bacterium]|nr:biopolymer transporter ExbD [Deltaproteobacteria bacterium]
MKIDRSRSRRARIEMIPLIDVIFLLLVAFILFSMTMTTHRGLNLDLPDASNAAVERDTLVVVSVAADGRLFLDGEPLEEGALKQRIAELRRAEPNHRVL